MKSVTWLLLVCLLALGCGNKDRESSTKQHPPAKPAATPEQAFEMSYAAMRDRDVDALFGLYSDRVLQDLKRMKTDLLAMPDSVFLKEFGFAKQELEPLDLRAVFKKLADAKPALASKPTPKIDRVEKLPGGEVLIHYAGTGGSHCSQRFTRGRDGWQIAAMGKCTSEGKPTPGGKAPPGPGAPATTPATTTPAPGAPAATTPASGAPAATTPAP